MELYERHGIVYVQFAFISWKDASPSFNETPTCLPLWIRLKTTRPFFFFFSNNASAVYDIKTESFYQKLIVAFDIVNIEKLRIINLKLLL